MKKIFLMFGFGAVMAMGLTYPQTALAQSAEQEQEVSAARQRNIIANGN